MKSHPLIFLALVVSTASSASTFTFAEGYSSRTPGTSAELSYRAFTIYSSDEVCARSPVPKQMMVTLDRPNLLVGERVHRTSASELIVETYDQDGRFLPKTPIIVNVDAAPDVASSRADWDYFQAKGSGRLKVTVRWLCGNVSGSVELNVVDPRYPYRQ